MKISSFIIGLVLIAGIVGALGYFFLAGATSYSQTLDNSTFAAYDELQNLNAQAKSVNTNLSNFNPYNPIDIIGGFLSGGYQAIKISSASFGIFTSMADDATNKVGDAVAQGGDKGFDIMLMLKIIAFIAFTFIIVSIFVGRDV